MAGIHDSETIDLVARDGDGRFVLIMIETRPWGSDAAQPNQLRAKFNSYAQFALDGSLIQQFPETANQPVAIRLDCSQPPTEEIAAIANRAADRLAEFGIDIIVNVNPLLLDADSSATPIRDNPS